jgi:hypothetical protein
LGAGLPGASAGYVVPGFDRTRVEELAGAAVRPVLADDRVDLLVIGMRLKPEIDANVRTPTVDRPYTTADRALLAEYGARAYESDAVKTPRIE